MADTMEYMEGTGYTGKRIVACWIVRAMTTGRMCSTGMCGWKRASGKPRKIFRAVLWFATLLIIIAMGFRVFPLWLADDTESAGRRSNLTGTAQRYLDRLGASVEDLFYHILAVLHDPRYRESNAGALRMEWPRIPLPGWPDGAAESAAAMLPESAARGRDLAALLDPETPVPGVTQVPLRLEIAAIAVPAATDERNMTGDDFALTAGWGHLGQGNAVMPGQGRAVERAHTLEERAAMGESLSALDETAFDVYLNGNAFWHRLPATVWNYKLGGYQY